MIKKLRNRILVAHQGDEGIALIMVMGFIVVLGLLMTATLGYAMNSQPQERRDQDWQAALAAAQAGVDDYVARLNGNDNYYGTIDCTNVALQGPTTVTNTCGWTATTATGWQNVQAGDPKSATFHYDVDSSKKDLEGAVLLTVTGKSRSELRTLTVKVGRGGSTQFLYYTDFESADPANLQLYTSTPSTACGGSGPSSAKYWWNGRNTAGCKEITFAAGDVLDGAVHFNDTPDMDTGTTFKKGFESSNTGCKNAPAPYTACTRDGSTPNIPAGNKAQFAGQLYLQDNSDQLGTYPGCQYTGDTRIKFLSSGKMTVWSKSSAGTTVGTGCGTATTAAGALGSTTGQTVDVPYNQVIYVKNKGSVHRCVTGEIGDGLPLANDWNYTTSTDSANYCGNGNVYVEGTVKGRVTIGSQNNVFVTGDMLIDGTAAGAAPSGSSMVGMIAANSVVVYHPLEETTTTQCDSRGRNCSDVTSYNNILSNSTRYIYASIQTLQHSFYVQGYAKGARIGTLSVRGSIAQRWRGVVASGSSTGYLKDYGYDTRLKLNSPPYFLQYQNASWSATVTGELKPAYSVDASGNVVKSG